MTVQEEHLKLLNETIKTISLQTFEDCDVQGNKVAANMLMQYGGAHILTPEGFISAIIQTHTLCLSWLLTDGYVTLRKKGRASELEQAERAERRAAAEQHNPRGGLNKQPAPRAEEIGAYL